MANELISGVNTGALAQMAGGTGLDGLIQPLIKEIHLFDTKIAGVTHLKDKTVLEAINIGDKLTLRREADNHYDEMAILVLAPDGRKLGYVPQKDNIIFSRLMDAGKMLCAKITEIKPIYENYTEIRIGIYLVDF